MPTVPALAGEFFESAWNVDSRVWRTLLVLLFKPGRLTKEYLDGRRARYLPPFRLYIVMSLAFFLVFSLTSGDRSPAAEADVDDAGAAQPPLADPDDLATPTADDGAPDSRAPPGFSIETEDGGWECDLSQADELSPRMRERFQKACEEIARDSGASFGRAFGENIPLMMFFFIPFVALIMKVLYLFARRRYVEHLLFFVHYHAFFFLLGTIAVLLGRLSERVPILNTPITWLQIGAWIYVFVYLFIAMRRVYAQGRLLTTVKYVLLGGGYFVSLLMTLVGVIVYTALTL